MLKFENQAYAAGYHKVAGIDEAGRGPLAGPVVAAACRLPRDFDGTGIDDSKKLTERQREALYARITEDPRVSFGLGIIDAARIDQINILQATIEAMLHAASQVEHDYLLVDGLALPNMPCKKIIKGDQLSLSIAAASILAKVTRDRLMVEFDARWPEYGFAKHKGYGTLVHRQAIQQMGPCPIHRMTFAPLRVPCEALTPPR